MPVDLLDKIRELLAKRPWYQLPRLLAMRRLIDMRDELRTENLHDTEEPPLARRPDNVAVTPEQRDTRTPEGSHNERIARIKALLRGPGDGRSVIGRRSPVFDSIHDALDRARVAAGDRDIRIGGGVATIRQYLEARLIDELHLAVALVLLGKGEHLLGGLDLPALGYACTGQVAGEHAVHLTISR